MTILTSPRLIGRRPELTLLTDALERARGGAPAVVLLGGDAGVGKTRLLTEFGVQVTGDARVLGGGCVDLGDGSLPYAPLVEALRRLRAELGADRLRTLAGPGSRALGALIPGLHGDAEVRPQEVDRGPLYEAVLTFLQRVSVDPPLVLILEDLHWADRSTLDLVSFLARNLDDHRLVLIASYRTDEVHRTHVLRPWLAELTRLPAAQRIEVAPFSREEVAEQVAAILGQTPDGRLVDEILDRSEGNAFYAEELLAAGAERGSLPPSLRDVLIARVAEVPDAVRAVVRVAAAAGRQVDHALLAKVAELPGAQLLDGLRDAVARQVLVTDRDGTAYRFRHALLQEVAYAELLPGERIDLHARLAQVLTEQPELAAGGAELAAGELAHHWAAAKDVPRAFTAAMAAAEADERHVAFAEAVTHLERMLDLWDQVPAELLAEVPPRHEVLAAASRVAGHAGEQRRSVAHARDAIDVAERTGVAAPVIAALLSRLSERVWLEGDTAGALEALDRALAIVGDDATIQLAEVLGWRSRLLVLMGRPAEALAPGERAIALAMDLGATQQEGYARNSVAIAHAGLGEDERALEFLHESRRLALQVGAVGDAARAFSNEVAILSHLGRFEEAVAVAEEGQRWADAQDLRIGRIAVLRLNAVEALLVLGRLDDAGRWLAATPLPRDETMTRQLHRQISGEWHMARGELELARSHAQEAVELAHRNNDAQVIVPTVTLMARLDRLDGRSLEGLDRLEAVLAEDEAWTLGAAPHLAVRLYARLAAEYVMGTRGQADARQVRETTLARFDRMYQRVRAAVDAIRPGHGRGALERALLTMEAERGWVVGAPDPQAWQRSLDGVPAGTSVLDQLNDQLRLAEAHAATGDLAAAASVAATTLTAATQRGALQLATELHELIRRHALAVHGNGDGSTRAPAVPVPVGGPLGSLTPREAEVLALVADGRTNREIGEVLFITGKTASVHVSNIIAKLGVTNRGEAAAIAHRAAYGAGADR